MPPWVVTFALLVLALLASWLLHAGIYCLSMRLLSRRDEFCGALLRQSKRPVRLAMTVIAVAVAVAFAPLTQRQETLAQHISGTGRPD